MVNDGKGAGILLLLTPFRLLYCCHPARGNMLWYASWFVLALSNLVSLVHGGSDTVWVSYCIRMAGRRRESSFSVGLSYS